MTSVGMVVSWWAGGLVGLMGKVSASCGCVVAGWVAGWLGGWLAGWVDSWMAG